MNKNPTKLIKKFVSTNFPSMQRSKGWLLPLNLRASRLWANLKEKRKTGKTRCRKVSQAKPTFCCYIMIFSVALWKLRESCDLRKRIRDALNVLNVLNVILIKFYLIYSTVIRHLVDYIKRWKAAAKFMANYSKDTKTDSLELIDNSPAGRW